MNRLLLSLQLSNLHLQKVSRKQNLYNRLNSTWLNKAPSEVIEFFKENLTPVDFVIARHYLCLFQGNRYVSETHDQVANATNTSRSSVKRCLKKLRDLDVIRTYYKNSDDPLYNKPNFYFLNEDIARPVIKHALQCLFRNMTFVVLSVISLCSATSVVRAEPPFKELNVEPTKISSLNTNFLESMFESLGYQDNQTWNNKLCSKKSEPITLREWDSLFEGKREAVMSRESIDLIQDNLDKLPLTTRGALKLGCYPVPVVQYILKQKLNMGATDLFSYILGIAKKQNASLGLAPVDYSDFDRASVVAGINNEPYIDADLFEALKQKPKQQWEASRSNNNAKAPQPTKWPTLEEQFEKQKQQAIRKGIDVSVMTRGDTIHALRMKYNEEMCGIPYSFSKPEATETSQVKPQARQAFEQVSTVDKLSTNQQPSSLRSILSDNFMQTYVQIQDEEVEYAPVNMNLMFE